MLFAFFPVCNLVLFSSAYLGIRNLTEQAVQSIAMSDSRKQAAETEKSVLANYENPLLTLFHRVQITPADTLQIAVDLVLVEHRPLGCAAARIANHAGAATDDDDRSMTSAREVR